MTEILATPFHARTAAANDSNHWRTRNGWTMAVDYGDVQGEAIGTRLNAGLADISWRWRVSVEGPRAEEFLARLLTRDPSTLTPGTAMKALWLSDGGGVRGAGAIARFGRDSFRIVSAASDFDWIARAACRFDVDVRDVSHEGGGLAIVGPFARQVVAAAGLDQAVEPLQFRKLFWRGLDVTLSRFGEHGGFELWCTTDDGPLVWDRIRKAGTDFALKPAGLDAMDILDLEAGVPRPERDYEPARDGFADAPSPFDLGLGSLVAEDHGGFNGGRALRKAARARACIGIEFSGETPSPHAPLHRKGQLVGHTRTSLYSPALRRAIALASVDKVAADPGQVLSCGNEVVRVCSLPFLPVPDSL
jgi:aminomethyltransferase